jgi:hypothetical protein
MIYLMNIHTGSVDTKENWESDYLDAIKSNEIEERGFNGDPWDKDLIEVIHKNGEWVEVSHS